MRAFAWLGVTLAITVSGCASMEQRDARDRFEPVRARRVERPVEPPVAIATDLDSLIARAVAVNPGLGAAYESWAAALSRVSQARSLPDPRLSYAYFLEPVETRVGPQRQRVEVSQHFPLFGKLGLKGDAAAAAADAAGGEYERTRRELVYRVTTLWNDLYYVGAAIRINEENVALLRSVEEVALRQYAAGEAPHATVIRTQVALARIENELATLRSRREPLLSALNAELDRPPHAPLAWPDTVSTHGSLPSREVLATALRAHSPALSAMEARVEEAVHQARLAGRTSIPDLSLGLQVVDTDEARFPNVEDSGKDAIVAMASINIPLWFGRNGATKKEANARRRAAVNARDELENRLLSDLDQMLFRFEDSDRRVDLYADTLISKADQSFRVTERAFTAGDAPFLDVIDTQRALLDFRLAYERALADRATAHAALERLVGVELGALRDSSTGGTR